MVPVLRLSACFIICGASALAGAQILGPANGGTGQDSSAATGCPSVTGGTWSFATCNLGTVTAVSVATLNGFQGTSSGGATPALTLNVDSSHFLPINTGSASSFLNAAGGYTVPAGTGVTAVSIATANGISGTSSGGATPSLTLALGAITPTSTNGVSAATMAFMDATSSVQTQLNGKQASLSTKSNCLTVTASFPCTVAIIAPNSTTSNITYTSWFTPTTAGVYRACGYVEIGASGSAGTTQLSYQTTFNGHAGNNGITTAINLTSAVGTVQQGCITLLTDAGKPILYAVLLTGATGTPTVYYGITLEQLQ